MRFGLSLDSVKRECVCVCWCEMCACVRAKMCCTCECVCVRMSLCGDAVLSQAGHKLHRVHQNDHTRVDEF